MRIVSWGALGLAAAMMTVSADARDYRGDAYREIDKVEREYREKFAKERYECGKKRSEASNRGEWNKARRECRQKLDDLTAEYREKLRYERRKLQEG